MDVEAGQSKTSGGRQAGDQEGAKLRLLAELPLVSPGVGGRQSLFLSSRQLLG